MVTPARRQYLSIKEQHPDALLLDQIGDFYETFDDDARVLARAVEVTLTSKEFGRDGRGRQDGCQVLIAKSVRRQVSMHCSMRRWWAVRHGLTGRGTPGRIIAARPPAAVGPVLHPISAEAARHGPCAPRPRRRDTCDTRR